MTSTVMNTKKEECKKILGFNIPENNKECMALYDAMHGKTASQLAGTYGLKQQAVQDLKLAAAYALNRERELQEKGSIWIQFSNGAIPDIFTKTLASIMKYNGKQVNSQRVKIENLPLQINSKNRRLTPSEIRIILEQFCNKRSTTAIAKDIGVSTPTAYRYIKLYKDLESNEEFELFVKKYLDGDPGKIRFIVSNDDNTIIEENNEPEPEVKVGSEKIESKPESKPEPKPEPIQEKTLEEMSEEELEAATRPDPINNFRTKTTNAVFSGPDPDDAICRAFVTDIKLAPVQSSSFLNVGLCANRHDMPVSLYIFDDIPSSKICNFTWLENTIEEFIDTNCIFNGETRKSLCVYCTGLQSALGALFKICHKKHINLALRHYDPSRNASGGIKTYSDKQIILNEFPVKTSSNILFSSNKVLDIGGFLYTYNCIGSELTMQNVYTITIKKYSSESSDENTFKSTNSTRIICKSEQDAKDAYLKILTGCLNVNFKYSIYLDQWVRSVNGNLTNGIQMLTMSNK